MKRVTVTLFIVGLVFEFAGFFGDQSANIPFVMRLVSPRYTHAQAGINALSASKALEPGQRGFGVLSDIFLAKLAEENDPNRLTQISVHRFSRGNARLGFSRDRAGEVIPINVTLSTGQTLEWELASVTREVDSIRNKSLFWLSLVVFLVGVAIQCIGFAVEMWLSKTENATSGTRNGLATAQDRSFSSAQA